MASRRVSISALLCQDDPPVTSPTRPSQSQPEGWSPPPKVPSSSPDSISPARQRSTRYHHDPYREGVPSHTHQTAAPRRTPSPDFSHPPLYAWPPPPPLGSRRAYNPPQVQDMFSSLQYDPEPSSSSPLRTSQQSQPPYMPPSPPRPSYSQSPFPTTRLSSDSPASTISLTRPPSIHSPSSPLLYTQRPAPSPGGYYHSPPFSTPYHHDPSFQASVSPNLRHPRQNSHTESVASSSMHHSSLSRISTTSSSSFPQALLNPVSPQQSPLGGLEALVQAATVERDRLEAKASLDRKADVSRSAVQRSPELLFRSSLEGPRMHLQAPAPRTPVTPPLMSGPLLRDSYSESSLRMGARPDVQTSKRRRQSDSLSGSERSWDSPLPLDSPSQFSGLMGPGMKPRRLSSEIRTEVRPTLPLPSRDIEEAVAAGSRMSPPRDHATRRSYMTEESRTFQTHVPDYREAVPSAIIAPDVSRYVFATEDPRPSVHQELRSNVDSHPPPRKILRSDLIARQGTPSPPPPPRPLSTPLEPSAPLAPTPPEQILPCDQDEECSPQWHSPPHNDIPTPTATAPQRFAEIESVASSEKTMDLTIRGVSTTQEPSTALADSLPPDNLTTTAQRSPVIPVSPPSSYVYDDPLGPAEPAKPPSPSLPSPEARRTDVALEAPDIESCPAISRLSSPAREDTLNQPTPEPETEPPPTTAPPSPRPSSPDASTFKDGISVRHPVAVQITAASETGTVVPLSELKDSVKAEPSFASPEDLEPTISPAVTTPAPAAEVISLPVLDVSPGTSHGHAPTAMDIDSSSEAALELAVMTESKPSQVDDQRHADMDVDEELLNLIGDDLPSRSSRSSFNKQESPPTEDKPHSPVKPEDAPGILISSPPSPAATALPAPQEGVSMLSPDTALSARDSETSTLRLDERSVPKKKVSYPGVGFLLVLLTPGRQNSTHNPKVAPSLVV
ncbi:hypothetical protein BJV78DRAFT_50525 [Lactifluus subvellereus]|nr:hypothetical protein BJV78DRAFT_50525 [Lactifluus subvellereus]